MPGQDDCFISHLYMLKKQVQELHMPYSTKVCLLLHILIAIDGIRYTYT